MQVSNYVKKCKLRQKLRLVVQKYLIFLWAASPYGDAEPIQALHGGILQTGCQELHRNQARCPLQLDVIFLYGIRIEK